MTTNAARATLPPDHPLRHELHAEVHARPSEALQAPLRLTFLALASDASSREREWQHVRELAARCGVDAPARELNHFSADLGAFRLKWERHSEFARYKFIVPGASTGPFEQPALQAVPAEWLAGLSGTVVVAAHAELLQDAGGGPGIETLAADVFGANIVIGSRIADGAGDAVTDFQLHDGFSRFLVRNRSMTPRQAGRMIQRLLEIETYRMMALLALPVAQRLTPYLSASERELSQITTLLADSGDPDEPALLDRLTRLEAGIESRESENAYRFAAAAAYYELVQRRIDELREERVHNLQTLREFMDRRLLPAMQTCAWAGRRLQALSERVSRISNLLRTRVEIEQQQSSRELLDAMNRRQKAQIGRAHV